MDRVAPEPTFDTPEEAAMVGFPRKYCRVVASCVEGDAAYVLLDTGSEGHPYLYGSVCTRENGRWMEGASSNGDGWKRLSLDSELGAMVAWEQAPANADGARVEFQGGVQEVPVKNGVYLAVWWHVPCPDFSAWPRVTAFRIDGRWS
jgi:hypothetical protein